MAEGKKRLERAVIDTLDQKKNKPRLFKGLMGAYVNGLQTVKVGSDRPDFVYVRLRGATGEVIQAFNDDTQEVFDLPVLVVRDEVNPHIWRVEGRDIGQYSDWGGASYLPPHGRSHSFTASDDDTGGDPVWIFKRQYMPFMPRPNASGTNTIYLEAEYYFWEGRYRYWPGSGTADLLQYRPTGGGAGRFVTVYIDGDLGIPEYLVGPEFSLIYPPADQTDFIPVPEQDQGFAVAAVSLQTGTERIGWQEIYDLRLPLTELPATGSLIGVYDNGAFLGDVEAISFEAGLDVVISGSFAYVTTTGTGGGGGGTGTVESPNKILLYDQDLDTAIKYDVSSGGFGLALDAAEDGDVIWIPPASIPGSSYEIPLGVHVVGSARSAVTINGTITLREEASLEQLTVLREMTDSTNIAKAIINHGVLGEESSIYNCTITAINNGTGSAYAISMEDHGDLNVWQSDVYGNGVGGGAGYGGWQDSVAGGTLKVFSSRVRGTTKPFEQE